MTVHPLPDLTDPVTDQFRTEVAHALETHSGAEATTHIADLFQVHRDAHRAQLAGTRQDMATIAAQDRVKGHMLGHISRSVEREVHVAARLAAENERHRAIERGITDVLDAASESHPEIVRQLRAVLSMPGLPAPRHPAPVTVAFAPDTRWTLGWFVRVGESDPTGLPFVGWSLVSDSGGIGQEPQASFSLGGRVHPLGSLERLGLMLDRIE